MATVDIRIQAQNQASREVLELRQQMVDLNRALDRQKRNLASATATERQSIQTRIEATQALRQQNQRRQQQLAVLKAHAVQAAREQKQVEALAKEQERLSNSTRRATRSFGVYLNSLANASFVYYAIRTTLSNLVTSTVRVAAEAERFNSVLTFTTKNAEAVGNQIRQLNRDLILTDFSTITEAFNALNAASGDAQESIDIIRGLGNAMGTLNVTAANQQRFFTQLSQAYAQNRLEIDELKILQETLPSLLNVSSRALGVQVSSFEALKDVLEESSLSARDYFRTLAEFSGENLPGADPTTFTAQSELLRESVRQIQRDIGEVLIPVLASGAREFRNFLSFFSSANLYNISLFSASVLGVVQAMRGLSYAFLIFRAFSFQDLLMRWITAIRAFGVAIGSFRINTTGLLHLMQSFNTAVTQAALSTKLLVASLSTLAIGYLIVRDEVRQTEESISGLNKALSASAASLTFDDSLSRIRQFSDLTVSELTRAVNEVETARNVIEAELGAIGDRFGISAIELFFFDTREVLRDFEVYGSGLDNLVEQIDQLKTEYAIADKTIQRFKNRIDELSASTEAAAVETSSLVVDIAKLNSLLQRAQSATQRALREPTRLEDYRDRINAIRSATADEIAVLRERAATETQLIEETEEDKNRIQARSIDIQTRLRRQIEQVQQQSEDRITEITEDAAEDRLEIEKRVLEQRYQAHQEFHANIVKDAFAQGSARVNAFLQNLGGITDAVENFTENVRSGISESITEIANFQRALEAVKQIATFNIQFQTQQFDLPQLFDQDAIQSVLLDIDVETRNAIRSIIEVYQELQRLENINIDFDITTREGIQEVLRVYQELQGLSDIEIEFDIETQEGISEVLRIYQELQRLENINIDFDITTREGIQEVLRVYQELQGLSDIEIEFDIDAIQNSLGFIANVFARYVAAFRQAESDAYADLELRILEGSQRVAERAASGFETAWRDARNRDATNTRNWVDFQARSVRQVARDLRRELRQTVRIQQQYAQDIVQLIDDVAISRNTTIKDALTSFLKASVRRLAQDFIETQIQIANQKRLQRELLKTAALRAGAAVGTQTLANVAGVASGGPAGLALGAVQAIQVFLQLGDREVRDISNIQDRLGRQRRR